MGPDLAAGSRLFDRGEFFAAHEAWEELWRVADDGPRRRHLQGLIQVAAGFHKLLVMGAPEPAVRLLTRGLAKLDGAELGVFCDGVRACRDAIEKGAFAPAMIPRLASEEANDQSFRVR